MKSKGLFKFPSGLTANATIKKLFIKLTLMFFATLFIGGCQNPPETKQAFYNVDSLTIEGILTNYTINKLMAYDENGKVQARIDNQYGKAIIA